MRSVPDSANQHDRVRNRIGWRERLASFRGSPVDLDLRAYDEPLAEIARLAEEIRTASDSDIAGRVRAVHEHVRAGGSSDRMEAPFFALAREVSTRVLGLRPFDVQIVAALALNRGAIVEMQTGEGRRWRR